MQGLGQATARQLSLLVWTCRDSSFLTNRRVFAAADCGIPDGIKVDEAGNVWTGTGEGVAVYSPGQLLALHCSGIMSSALKLSPELVECLQNALMLQPVCELSRHCLCVRESGCQCQGCMVWPSSYLMDAASVLHLPWGVFGEPCRGSQHDVSI